MEERGQSPTLDGIDRAFLMVLADGRRKLEPDEELAAKTLWRRVFRLTPERSLLLAVQTWLTEHARGRPNVGEVLAALKALVPAGTQDVCSSSEVGAEKRAELRWAASILEAYERNLAWRELIAKPDYRHTLEGAQDVLRRRGFSSWQDARTHLEPGWVPPVTTEIIT